MTEFYIRPYRSNDRSRLFQIGADTTYFGDPIEVYLDDRQIFLDAFYLYYTDLEPGYSWVATSEGEVIGFLAGCVNTRKYQRDIVIRIIPRVLTGLLRKKYKIGRRSFSYFKGLVAGVVHGGFSQIDKKTYPAHLHINIEQTWRGHGLGKKLIQAYLDQLSSLGVPGVHLETNGN